MADDFDKLGIPICVKNVYKAEGLEKLFPWQMECLQISGVLDGSQNLVYSAPTSAGKTLVAEVLMLNRILKVGKKVLFILPFVSVAREKMFGLRSLFEGTGIVVGGFMGGTSPAGGFASVDIAICTIEKANWLVNKHIEGGNIEQICMVVVDELHMVGDSGRGYLLELLLTKLKFISQTVQKCAIQIVGMSATSPNLHSIATWLNADVYVTDFRPVPLKNYVKVGKEIYDENLVKVRNFIPDLNFENDDDGITSLCFETIKQGNSVLIFCPTKAWCEKLATTIAKNFYMYQQHYTALESITSRTQSLIEVYNQLQSTPAGIDPVLKLTIPYGVAYHHAGLTMEERDIVENGFRSNSINILVATSTLSSGVNLPARRVIIRTPLFHRKMLDVRMYHQMTGRAGRKGKDSLGESILICQHTERKSGFNLMTSGIPAVMSCLAESGNTDYLTTSMKRSILEVIGNGLAHSVTDIVHYMQCTLLYVQSSELCKSKSLLDQQNASLNVSVITKCIDWLCENEFVFSQNECSDGMSITRVSATQLGRAALLSSLPTAEALLVLADLQVAAKAFVLDTELHLVYQVTPIFIVNEWSSIDWFVYLQIYETLPAAHRRASEVIGIEESFLTKMASTGGIRGRGAKSEKHRRQLNIHIRFFAALILHDLTQEKPLNAVCAKYECNKGTVQGLQQSAAVFSGMVTAFCQELGWWSLEVLFKHFQARLLFGVQHELIDLTQIYLLDNVRARALHSNGLKTCVDVSLASEARVETILRNSKKFESKKEVTGNDGEAGYDKIKIVGSLKILSITEAAEEIVREARKICLAGKRPVEELKQNIVIGQNAPTGIKDSGNNSRFQHLTEPVSVQVESTSIFEDRHGEDNTVSKHLKERNGLDFVRASGLKSDDEVISETNVGAEGNDNILKSGESCLNQTRSLDNQGLNSSHFTVENTGKPSNDIITEGLQEESPIALLNTQIVSELNDVSFHRYPPKTSHQRIIRNVSNNVSDESESLEVASDDEATTKLPFSSFQESTPVNGHMRKVNRLMPPQNITPVICGLRNSPDQIPLNQMVNGAGQSPLLAKNHSKSEDDASFELFQQSPSLIRSAQSSNHSAKSTNKLDWSSDSIFKTTNFSESNKTMSMENLSADGRNKTRYSTDEFSLIWESHEKFFLINACKSLEIFQSFLQKWKKVSKFSFQLVGVDKYQTLKMSHIDVSGICVCWNSQKVYFVDFTLPFDSNQLERKHKVFISSSYYVEQVTNTFLSFDSSKTVVAYNLKDQLQCLFSNDHLFKLNFTWFDPTIARWIVNPDADILTMDMLIKQHLPEEMKILLSNDHATDGGSGNYQVDQNVPTHKCCSAVASYCSTEVLMKNLNDGGALSAFNEIEMPHQICIALLEHNGIPVDVDLIVANKKKLLRALHNLQQKSWAIVGRKFNLCSPAEISKILFDELRLSLPEDAKPHHKVYQSVNVAQRRKRSTNKETLQLLCKLSKPHPLPQVIMDWRSVNHALYKSLLPIDSTLHVSQSRFFPKCFHLTSTGRISMSEPNIQNMSKAFKVCLQTEGSDAVEKLGGKVIDVNLREVFVAEKNFKLISADFSQLELRILAHFSEEPKLIDVFNNADQADIFCQIATLFLNVSSISKVTNEERQRAKHICYGIIYGMGATTLAKQLNTDEKSAQQLIDCFMHGFPKLRMNTQKLVEGCKKNGYIVTLGGRRRYLLDISSSKMKLRSHAERQAVNSTIQGSAADIVKTATCDLLKQLQDKQFKIARTDKDELHGRCCFLVHHLHDELIFEVDNESVDEAVAIIRSCLTNAYTSKLKVKLAVKLKVGQCWGQMVEQVYNM